MTSAAARRADRSPPDASQRGPRGLAGGTTALAISVAIFTRYRLDDTLKRDEAIYAYAGQQLTHGVAPYASIFDPKTPLASLLTGVGAAVGNAVGVNDLKAMRLLYLLLSCATVLAVYALARTLFRSDLAALASATVFASFRGFAMDALAGPDAKTPGLLFGMLAMVCALRRRWFAAGLLGALAFLVWQPLAIYVAVALLAAAVGPHTSHRLRALARIAIGALLPVVIVAFYFATTGAFGRLVEAAVDFPLTGVKRAHRTLSERGGHILSVVMNGYRESGWLFLAGTVLFLGLALAALLRRNRDNSDYASRVESVRQPFLTIVVASFLGIVVFSLADFQGIPDLYPLLVYSALGVGGAVATGQRALAGAPRRALGGVGLIGVLVLTFFALSWSSNDKASDRLLSSQRADACALSRLAGSGVLYSLGDPTPLVLSHRQNPSRFVYLNSGVDHWVINRTPGGIAGWHREILATRPAVVTLNHWFSKPARRTDAWLASTYDPGYVGRLRVFLAPGVRQRAATLGINVTTTPVRSDEHAPAGRC